MPLRDFLSILGLLVAIAGQLGLPRKILSRVMRTTRTRTRDRRRRARRRTDA